MEKLCTNAKQITVKYRNQKQPPFKNDIFVHYAGHRTLIWLCAMSDEHSEECL